MTKFSILIVDDDVIILKAIEMMLFEKGVNVDVASSGHEAISKIEIEKIDYDVILCDLHMPKMNGIEFGKRFYKDFPIVLMTGFLEEHLRNDILNICDAYIEKLDASERIYPALMKAIERKKIRTSFLKVA